MLNIWLQLVHKNEKEEMMLINEKISGLHKKLKDRQWLEIQNQTRSFSDGFQQRKTKREQMGMALFQTTIATSGITAEDFNRCLYAANSDPRFQFLTGLPGVALMYSTIAVAFQDSCFGSRSAVVGETAALNGIIARILDSLIDDVPKIIAPERSTLFRLLNKQGWLESTILPADEELDTKHPAASVLYKFIRGWITKVKGAEYWQQETSSIPDEFSSAVEAALTTEYDTIGCVLPASSEDYNPDVRHILLAKSRNTFWIPAMTPALFVGWPEGLNKTAYKSCIHRFGDLIGWLDDMTDIIEDIEKGEANEILLDLYENAGKPHYASPEEFQDMLLNWLDDDRAVTTLVTKGRAIYSETIQAFESLGRDTTPILHLTTDLTQLALKSVTA